MNPHDHEPDDPDLDAAFSRLPRTLTPSEGYADRVLGGLRQHGLVSPARPGAHRMLIAAAWFIAGVGTGAAALTVIRRNATDAAPMIAASSAIETPGPAEPAEWY